MNAVALNSAAFNLTKVIGPSLGGVLILFSGCRRKFLCPKRRLHRRARVDLLDVHPADTNGSAPIVGHCQSQGRIGLCLVKPFGVCANGHRIGPQDICGAVSNSDARVSKGRPQSRSRRIGSFVGSAGVGAMLAGLMLATLANRVRRQGVLMLVSLVSLGVVLNLFSWTTSFPMAILAL